MKSFIFLTKVFFYNLGISQVTYLDFTGLTNSSPITSIPIGGTGETFDASISLLSGSPSDPTVSNDGNFEFRMNSATSQQCLNLTFSTTAQLFITDNGITTNILNTRDSLSFGTSGYTLTDPSSNFNAYPTSIVPNTGVTSYTSWNITFDGSATYTVCGQRVNPGGGSVNTYLPIRIGVITSTLPIELFSFEAKGINNEKVELKWQTASEINNDYFTIERSKNGLDWEEINRVDGGGNSSSNLNYSSTDFDPYLGLSYYRLKQTDFNGEFEYSVIKSVNLNMEATSTVQIYPNPTNDQIIVSGDNTELTEIKIFNALGQSVRTYTSIITSQNENSVTIDMSNLSTGLYYIKTKTTANKVYKK